MMNREELAKLYEKANGWSPAAFPITMEELERFAALVAAAERNRTWTQEHWTEYERSIAATEREACAKVCDEMASRDTLSNYYKVAANAIRARGNT